MSRRRKHRRPPPIPGSIVVPARWRRNGLWVLGSILIAVGLVCARSKAPRGAGDDWSRYHDRTFRVARVIDGDTLDIEAPDGNEPVTRIRLWGVDAPETRQQGATYFGAEAAQFARKTLQGRTVHVALSPDSTRGRYGRLLAYVFLERGGAMFNEMLLEEGLAYADPRFAHPYKQRFQTMERRARRADKGLWAQVTLDKMPPWRQRLEKPAVADTP